MRLAPDTEKNHESVKSELEIIGWLRSGGFPAMEPVVRKDGSCLARIETEWGNFIASAFYAVKGRALEDTDFSMRLMWYGLSTAWMMWSAKLRI